ncbi:hypothetical protein V5O48_009848 [Marasmius crinis-equi]|uniref:F-box domain-containing protein n=1 Tax=Marasmius crinis-equi TaxID=585013 RepID=A0ABR3F9Z2_9AGAR
MTEARPMHAKNGTSSEYLTRPTVTLQELRSEMEGFIIRKQSIRTGHNGNRPFWEANTTVRAFEPVQSTAAGLSTEPLKQFLTALDDPCALQYCPSCGQSTEGAEKQLEKAPPEVIDVLYRSNDPPITDNHLIALHQFHQETASAIGSLESRISRLRKQAEELELQKIGMEKELRRCWVITSAVRRLPHDVLTCICDHYADVADPTNENVRNPPWTLTKVCRRWRSSVSSLPRLWTFFNLNLLDNLDVDQAKDRVLLQLSRCQDQPMQVIVGDLIRTSSSTMAEEIIPILCANKRVSHWRQASIDLDHDDIAFFSPYAGLFNGLERLQLNVYTESTSEIALDVFSNAPSLRRLTICGDNDLARNLALPWSQITHYTARDSPTHFTTNGFHYITLPRLTSLQICWLDCVITDWDETPGPPVVLPLLHTLILSSAAEAARIPREESGIVEILDWITLPALRTLKLPNSLRGSSRSIRELIQRSDCSLLEFALFEIMDSETTNVSDLITSGCLRTVQTLSTGWTLSHSEQAFDNVLHTALTRHVGQEDHLPNLACFQTDSWESNHGLIELYNMVRSRRSANGNNLGQLILQDSGSLPLRAAESWRETSGKRFETLRKEGLRLEWRDKGIREMF